MRAPFWAVGLALAISASGPSAAGEFRRGADHWAGDNFTPYWTWFPGVEGNAITRISGAGLEVATESWPIVFKHCNLSIGGFLSRYAPPDGFFVIAPEPPEMRRIFAGRDVIKSDNLRIAFYPASGPRVINVTESDWTHRVCRAEYGEGRFLEYVVSRLSPAVLFSTNDSRMTLFTGMATNLTYGGQNNTLLGTGRFARNILDYVRSHPGEFPRPVDHWYLQDWGGFHVLDTQEKRDKARRRWGHFITADMLLHPTGLAVPTEKGVRTFRMAELDGADLSEPWALVWFGGASPFSVSASRVRAFWQVDIPFLVRFERTPEKLTLGEEGLEVRFGGQGGRFALMPLFGGEYLRPQDTELWHARFPNALADRCRFFSKSLTALPIRVREDFRVDESTGSVVIRNSFDFIEMDAPDARRFAPVCPSVVDAWLAGLPVRFSQPVQVGSYVDQFGHWGWVEGVKSYTYEVGDALGYVFESPSPRDPGAVPARLREKLSRHLEKMIGKGHLAPYYTNIGHSYLPIAWECPGDLILALCEALPYLNEEQRDSVAGYLRSEIDAYPPTKVWMYPLKEGTRRERYAVPDGAFEDIEARWMPNREYGLPPMTMYALALWAERCGEWPYIAERWEAIREAFRDRLRFLDWTTSTVNSGAIDSIHRHIAGAIGYARMAKRLGLPREADLGAYVAAKLILSRLGLYRLPETLYNEGIHPDTYAQKYGGAGGSPGYEMAVTRDVLELAQFGPVLGAVQLQHQQTADLKFAGMTPELARVLGDYSARHTRKFVDMVEEAVPLWYVREGANWIRSEDFLVWPLLPGKIFQARASVLREDPAVLEKFFDMPICTGDLLYIRNLAALMERHAGASWRRMDDTVAVQGFAEPERMSLEGKWRFKLDPGAEGLAAEWWRPSRDITDWDEIRVPGLWEQSGYLGLPNGSCEDRYEGLTPTDQGPYNGIGWYRRDFHLGGDFAGKKTAFVAGRIDDFDWTYVNGVEIGHTDRQTNPDDFWRVRRVYGIPEGVLRFGGSLDLVGKWKFSPGTPEVAAAAWSSRGYDDSRWQDLSVPGEWEKQGLTRQRETSLPQEYRAFRVSPSDGPFNGLGLYRKRVRIPEAWRDHRVFIELGAVRDFDRVYVNGREIGRTDAVTNPDDYWTVRRIYEIPREAIRPGEENVIAVSVLNLRGPGGVTQGPVRLFSKARNVIVIQVYDINHLGGIMGRPVELVAK